MILYECAFLYREIHVFILFQTCCKVLDVLESGQLGECSHVVRSFCSDCSTRFPMATAFKPMLLAPGEQAAGGEASMHSATRPVRSGRGTTDDTIQQQQSLQ